MVYRDEVEKDGLFRSGNVGQTNDLMLDVTLDPEGGEQFAYEHGKVHIYSLPQFQARRRRRRLTCFTFIAVALLIAMMLSLRSEEKDSAAASAYPSTPPIFEVQNSSATGVCKHYPSTEPEWIQRKDSLEPNQLCRAFPGCQCRYPRFPHAPGDDEPAWKKLWDVAFQRNLDIVERSKNFPPKMVVYGDSMVERFLGTSVGRKKDEYDDYSRAFTREFDDEALPLGIAADRTENLLYRLHNGELPEHMQPDVFWIVIGEDNFQLDRCSEESVVVGNMEIAEYILKEKPNSLVVINSILPRGGKKGLLYKEEYGKINTMLKCYTETNDRLFFFDADPIFIVDGAVDRDMMPDGFHPGGIGAQFWVDKMKAFANEITGKNLWSQ